MRKSKPMLLGFTLIAALLLGSCTTTRPVETGELVERKKAAELLKPEEEEHLVQAVAPKEFPRIPAPSAEAAWVADGYQVEMVVQDLTYPTSVEFGSDGNMYVAEAGFSYGDPVGPARVWKIGGNGEVSIMADQLSGPVNDLLWHNDQLYISQWGKVSAVDKEGNIKDLVTGLPESWDHHTNQMTVGPDGKIYFGVGAATNSGVVGIDNLFPYLWLAFYPDFHDIPAKDIELTGQAFTTPDPLTVASRPGELVTFLESAQQIVSAESPLLVKTGAFQPFGKSGAVRIKGQHKANACLYRINSDGSGLEVYAWGFRNPFGAAWDSDGELYVSDHGYDERGSRPIANAPDSIWQVKKDQWYGYPDFAAGIPVTDARFQSDRGKAVKFLMKNHPPVDKPFLTRPPHSGVTKMDFSTSADFGFDGQLFLGEFGSGYPITSAEFVQHGPAVVRIDLATKDVQPFFGLREGFKGPDGYEYAATKGPRHPVEVHFSSDGNALYIVDFGSFALFPAGAGPAARPFPGSGVIWRVTKTGTAASGPPANLSVLPGKR